MKSLRRSLNNGHGHSHSNSQGHIQAGPSHAAGQGYPQTQQYPGPGGPSGMPMVGSAGSAGSPGGVNVFSNPLPRPADKVAPPQKVIKALASHRSTNPQELSYQKGDFWYVTGEREGWYEALNPITGSRGLVPKRDFEVFIKGGRQASASDRHGASETSSPTASSNDHQRSQSTGMPAPNPMRSPTAPAMMPVSAPVTPGSKRGAQPLYAIVQYDFHAERPDELEAKAGEPIVVIAQSNHEWFVAKPIGRLGGPGLIPVAFVEIRDPVTGQPLEAFPSNIPQVEEWKKATAEYKAAAIPLGRLDLAPDQRVANSPYEQAAVKVSQTQPTAAAQDRNSYRSRTSGASGGGGGSHTRQHSRATSRGTARTGYKPEQDALLPPGELVQLSVPSFHNESGNYWFRLHAEFVPDELTEPAYTLILYRTYEDFYDFQITLLDTFPTEAGRPLPGEDDSPPRILPYMPGPVDEAIDDELTEYRRDELNAYVVALLDLRSQGAAYILRHELIRTFFAAKYGDYCEENPREQAMEQLQASLNSMRVNGNEYKSEPTHAFSSPRPEHTRNQSSNSIPQATVTPSHAPLNLPNGYSPSSPAFPTAVPTQRTPPSAATATPTTATATPIRPPRAGAAFVKIKVYDRATDDLIALRVHPAVTYAELLEKVRARLGPEVNVLQYRSGGGPVAASGNRLIRDDRELAEWMGVEEQRLVLYAEQ